MSAISMYHQFLETIHNTTADQCDCKRLSFTFALPPFKFSSGYDGDDILNLPLLLQIKVYQEMIRQSGFNKFVADWEQNLDFISTENCGHYLSNGFYILCKV